MEVPSPEDSLQLLGHYSNFERYSIAAWLSFVLFTSLIGNSLVLVGSLKHRAIRLDSITTTFIQHVAVADIGTVVCFYPVAVSFITDRIYFGTEFCVVRFYIGSAFQVFGMLLICALNASKLISVLHPLRSAMWTKSKGHGIVGIIWGITTIFFSYLGISTIGAVVYTPDINTCLPDITRYNPTQMAVFKCVIFLITCLPVLVTLVTTCWLLIMTLKMARSKPTRDSPATLKRQHANIQGVVTVIAIGILFLVSFGPWFILLIVMGSVVHSGECSRGIGVLQRLFVCLLFLNNICNFIIYASSIRSFKRFVVFKLLPAFIRGYFIIRRTSWEPPKLNSKRDDKRDQKLK